MWGKWVLTSDEQLGHCNEANDISREHGIDICFADGSDMLYPFNEAGIVNCMLNRQ